MKIYIDPSIESYITNSINKFENSEIGFLALGKIVDKTVIIDNIFKEYTEGNTESKVTIDKLSQLSLIKYCMHNNFIPVIIHTHVVARKKFGFSYEDNLFEQSFAKAANTLGYHTKFISILYSKVGYVSRIFNQYYFRYIKINNHNRIKNIRKFNYIGFYFRQNLTKKLGVL